MRNVIHVLVTSFAFLTMAACAQLSSQPEHFETVTLPGTGDSQDLLRELARAYGSQFANRKVIVPDSTGSDGGIRVVGTGSAPIGRISRLPTPEESAQYGDFKYLEFARVPVGFVVSPEAGVSNLDEQQVCNIFSGRITNWKDVGGHDLRIAVQARPDSGSNMQAIRKSMACFASLKVNSSARFNLRNSDLVESMKTVSGAIGFMPFSEALLHGFKAVTLNGIAPDMAQYKVGVGLGFVYKKPLSPSIQAFIHYLKSESARQIIHRTGHTLAATSHEVVIHAQSAK